jgi:phage-related protein
MALKQVIKKSLKETKIQKETILVEHKIVQSRLKMIVENFSKDEKFKKLSEQEQGKICVLFLMEMSSLNDEGLLNENFIDTLKNIFGAAFWSVPEAFTEKALNSLLGALGFPDNSIRKFLVSFFATNPSELLKSFKDCKVLTKHIVRAIGETLIMNLQQSKGMGGTGMDIVRNALQNELQNLDFLKKLEETLSGSVCQVFEKYSGNAKEVLDKLKPALSQATK